ncbi:MAG: DUF427 domain-containing protein [Candidatus Lambdaproteobacteria bacterium]|nr:DUF427 domain-containing protein [Candidatus Lambdaproteobacteria bacterium]
MFRPGARGPVDVLPCPKRVRVHFAGKVIADSTRVLLLREPGQVPAYYFPWEDVWHTTLQPSAHVTASPHLGTARYWSLASGGRTAPDAVWAYDHPQPAAQALAGHVAFRWDAMEAWYEEDQQVYLHPRDPYVRIDILECARRVRVLLDGETVADSRQVRMLIETGAPVRYYFPPEDIRTGLLVPTEMRSLCCYKGEAHYWSANIAGRIYDNVAWSYPEPLPEVSRIAGCICFYPQRVQRLEVEAPAGRPGDAVKGNDR